MSGDFSDPVITDPFCDEMYAVCDSCPTRPQCDVFASGQITQCATVMSGVVMEAITSDEFGTNDQLEQQFDHMIRNANVPIMHGNSPRRSGYGGCKTGGHRTK